MVVISNTKLGTLRAVSIRTLIHIFTFFTVDGALYPSFLAFNRTTMIQRLDLALIMIIVLIPLF